MKRKRDANLSEYGISEFAYREMLYFCMQYEEKKEKLKNLYSISSISYDKEKVMSSYQDMVFEKASKAIILKDDLKIIEKAAKETDEFLWDKIIDNVCYQIALDYIDVPCGRRQFYNKRKLFFVRLYKYLNERKRDTQVT